MHIDSLEHKHAHNVIHTGLEEINLTWCDKITDKSLYAMYVCVCVCIYLCVYNVIILLILIKL